MPRRAARARFSSICMVAAVPIMGSWNTRPMYWARLNSARPVTSTPPMVMVPESTGNTPAMALSMVDFPAPLPPMTVTKSPSSMVRFKPWRATFSLTVPGLKVFQTFCSLSMGYLLLSSSLVEILLLPVGHGQEHRHNQGGDELEVVGVDGQGADDKLDDDVVENRAQRHRQQL